MGGYYHQDERDAAAAYGCLTLGIVLLIGLVAAVAAILL